MTIIVSFNPEKVVGPITDHLQHKYHTGAHGGHGGHSAISTSTLKANFQRLSLRQE